MSVVTEKIKEFIDNNKVLFIGDGLRGFKFVIAYDKINIIDGDIGVMCGNNNTLIVFSDKVLLEEIGKAMILIAENWDNENFNPIMETLNSNE